VGTRDALFSRAWSFEAVRASEELQRSQRIDFAGPDHVVPRNISLPL
jgi:hypothetical protein